MLQKELYNGIAGIWNIAVKLFLKHPALPVEVALNRNYPRRSLASFATLWQFSPLLMSSK
jgi:hypothetical protein